ncbi:MAG: hypothetical protein ACREXT_14175 [Gammaproteobacteria bacterium]
MPLQNRVNPRGQLLADPSRACLLMGNRGILHDEHKRIVRSWVGKAWLTCRLEFGNLKRKEVFRRGSYSELFFLDEATAFSAGHRPCAYCQRKRFKRFKEVWLRANRPAMNEATSINEIDRQLHTERVRRGGEKITYLALLSTLPSGTFVEHAGEAKLWRNGRLQRWSLTGYAAPEIPQNPSQELTVLTPRSVVRMFEAGFNPGVYGDAHPPDVADHCEAADRKR